MPEELRLEIEPAGWDSYRAEGLREQILQSPRLREFLGGVSIA